MSGVRIPPGVPRTQLAFWLPMSSPARCAGWWLAHSAGPVRRPSPQAQSAGSNRRLTQPEWPYSHWPHSIRLPCKRSPWPNEQGSSPGREPRRMIAVHSAQDERAVAGRRPTPSSPRTRSDTSRSASRWSWSKPWLARGSHHIRSSARWTWLQSSRSCRPETACSWVSASPRVRG